MPTNRPKRYNEIRYVWAVSPDVAVRETFDAPRRGDEEFDFGYETAEDAKFCYKPCQAERLYAVSVTAIEEE